MSTKSLARLADRYSLGDQQVEQLKLLAEMAASLDISGTSITDVDGALDIHIADSLAGLELNEISSAASIADIGSGAGFPGLALAVALPRAAITLVDSVRKKSEVAARLAKSAGLANVTSVWSRAEEFSALGSPARASFDVVTARALAELNVLLEYAAPLLQHGGSIIAWKGEISPTELAGAKSAEQALGFERTRVEPYEPFARSERRHFYTAQRTGELSDDFPRRAGVARRKPIRD
jgi:16S rRNA (guanine527-N7)-methyltransferase